MLKSGDTMYFLKQIGDEKQVADKRKIIRFNEILQVFEFSSPKEVHTNFSSSIRQLENIAISVIKA